MKVISIIEPWASLIKERVKYIETRSWKTNYRGEIYIHASKKVLTKTNHFEYKNILDLLSNKEFNYGYIIAKCRLVDCVLMTEEFIKKIKNNHNEYICGDYSVGRYAWILEDIEEIEPIKVNGSLGIWTHKE